MIWTPSSRDTVLVDKEAVQSTVVVLTCPSVLVMLSQVRFQVVGVVVPQTMPLGMLNEAVVLPGGIVIPQAHPSGQTVPVGVARPHK